MLFRSNSTKTFSQSLTGDMQVLGAPWATGSVPDAPMNFKTLYKIGSFMREEMLAEPFATREGEFFQVMASADQIENFRNDADVKEDLIGLTTGSFKLGEESISGYQFMGYRGFAFGVDQQPLRATGFDGSGNLILVNPTVSTAVTNGFAQRRNPAWVSAPYEVMFVIAEIGRAHV